MKEYWLMLGPEKQIEVYRQPAVGKFAEAKTHGPGGRLVCRAVPEVELDLDAFFEK